jgi:ribosomal-protein-alanine N-acetyltransferase
MIEIRPAAVADAEELTALYQANWDFLSPFEPDRDANFLTVEGQRDRLATAELQAGLGSSYRCVIVEDGAIVGMISLSAIERGPAQSAHLGYWVARAANGRGVASRAVELMLQHAFGPLALHRVQAGTLLDNLASQRVLSRNGFELIGVARSYLKIAGSWQDHILFQKFGPVP